MAVPDMQDTPVYSPQPSNGGSDDGGSSF
jgi:hypothetical protein